MRNKKSGVFCGGFFFFPRTYLTIDSHLTLSHGKDKVSGHLWVDLSVHYSKLLASKEKDLTPTDSNKKQTAFFSWNVILLSWHQEYL